MMHSERMVKGRATYELGLGKEGMKRECTAATHSKETSDDGSKEALKEAQLQQPPKQGKFPGSHPEASLTSLAWVFELQQEQNIVLFWMEGQSGYAK